MKKTYIWTFIVLLTAYVVLAFTVPSDPAVLAKYSLTQEKARLLNLTIIIPIAAIYLTALYGFLRFNDYTVSVQKTKEGPYFKNLSRGLMLLAFGLPLTAVVNSLFSHIKYRHPDFLPTSIILRNYLALILTLAAIYFVAKGAQGLFNTLRNKKLNINPSLALAGPIILASLFTWLITAQDNGINDPQGYYLPDWLVITTIAIPYTFIWCTGIKAVLHLQKYKAGVKGTIYKQAFSNLSLGIGVIIIISVLLRLLTTLSGPLNRLNLTPMLLLIYVLIILYAIGYGLVTRGAKKLKQIEEV